MKGITTIAALPGSGSGCLSALPAEVGKKREFTIMTVEEAHGIAKSLDGYEARWDEGIGDWLFEPIESTEGD